LSGFIRKCKRVNSFTEIDKTNGNVLFSVNKELQNKVFSERYGFLLKEYKFANKDNWHNEVNNFYNVCVEIGKK
jgi:polyphosphate kinase 2 (PPK2 family)